jgi:hypothetical protein
VAPRLWSAFLLGCDMMFVSRFSSAERFFLQTEGRPVLAVVRAAFYLLMPCMGFVRVVGFECSLSLRWERVHEHDFSAVRWGSLLGGVFLFCSAPPCVNHDAEYGLAVGYDVFISPVISLAGRGLHVKTAPPSSPALGGAFRWGVV